MSSTQTATTTSAFIPVERTVTCRRCGQGGLAWLRSRNDKPYLVRVREFEDGTIAARKNDFHLCPKRSESPTAISAPATMSTSVPTLAQRVEILERQVEELRKAIGK